MSPRPLGSTLFPYTTLFRSAAPTILRQYRDLDLGRLSGVGLRSRCPSWPAVQRRGEQHGVASRPRVLETSQSRFPTCPPRSLPAGVEAVSEQGVPGQELIGRSGIDLGDTHMTHRVI